MSDKRGIFIAIDGIDGSGKTTLCGQLETLLVSYDPVVTKEPTDESEWGKRLRRSAVEGRLPRDVEIEYFHKDRMHHISKFIKPNLEAGNVVICDRYVDSTLAFQADDSDGANALLRKFSTEIVQPDITIILKCSVEIGLGRINKFRDEISTFENVEVLTRANSIYNSRSGDGYAFVDATGSPRYTLSQVVRELASRFPDIRENLLDHYKRLYPEDCLSLSQ